MLKKLLGDSAYAEEYDADEEPAEDAPDQDEHVYDGAMYASVKITSLQADDWTTHEIQIPLGEEVAVMETNGEFVKIRYGCTTGWAKQGLLSSTAPRIERFVNSPGNAARIFDSNYQAVHGGVAHAASVGLVSVKDEWSHIRCSEPPGTFWINSGLLVTSLPDPPPTGKG